jgi:hypothetical protein
MRTVLKDISWWSSIKIVDEIAYVFVYTNNTFATRQISNHLLDILSMQQVLLNMMFINKIKHADWYELLCSLNIFLGTGDNSLHGVSLQSCPIRSVVADYGCHIPVKRGIHRIQLVIAILR